MLISKAAHGAVDRLVTAGELVANLFQVVTTEFLADQAVALIRRHVSELHRPVILAARVAILSTPLDDFCRHLAGRLLGLIAGILKCRRQQLT